MTSKTSITTRKRKIGADVSITFGLATVIFFFVASGLVSYWNIRTLNQNSQAITHTHTVISALDNIISLMKDAETGQRGYVLTGNDTYLKPYADAVGTVDQRLDDIRQLVQNEPAQLDRLPALQTHVKGKLSELADTIELRRTKGFEEALIVITTDRGKKEMDLVRSQIAAMQQTEQEIRERRFAEIDNAFKLAVSSGILTGILGVLLSGAVAYLVRRTVMIRQREGWLQSGQVGLTLAMSGDPTLHKLAEKVLQFLAEYLDAQAGIFFTNNNGTFERAATYGIPEASKTPKSFDLNDGLLGQAVKDNRTFLISDVPEGYLTMGSGLGQSTPRHLVISPTAIDGYVNAIFELGFVHPLDELTVELLERVSETVSTAVRSAYYRVNLQNFLEETQRQAEELQTQSEELRVSNEELEEQSRALKASQSNLEQQQTELQQTNAQLEEQTQLLENERDELNRTKAVLQGKAQELEQASQYKSDFLANMSHELRTPLNSSLILAKLLADNPTENLTEEQVKYAQTIHSAGNDLLSLINDILDLSKIEAGHMEVRLEAIPLPRLTKDLLHIFEPIALQKGLALDIRITPGCPDTIETDRQRLEQVLKNLLSNALKFTEKGKVELTIGRTAKGKITFAVTDTGIGISKEHQEAVFEAFRQADNTISRKYGGTGLGLSISRELTRLLGGNLQLTSESGKGSTFIITLPERYDPAFVRPRTTPEVKIVAIPGPTLPPLTVAPRPRSPRLNDDREHLQGNARTLVVIEDDEIFAHILLELAHELNFQCVVTTTAEEGVIAVRQYMPSAVLLDLGLPDNNGLSVLDRLKHDPRTRHIPVHVISASDHTQTALSLGAIGYMIKPVKREELVNALKQLETRFTQRMRRVLIVEDDPVQSESLSKLLASHDVKTVLVGTAAECLKALKDSTFDCMVLDLSLPDASGHSLLETLSQQDAYSFPPVIVYTGRDISADEEHRLRRYSKSIIIKGAKSPERLLDEVTLFLHQVVSELPAKQQKMLEKARNRDAALEGRRILVVEDDIRNVYALTGILEPHGAVIQIARNGKEALQILAECMEDTDRAVDLILMDVMMPEMDGLTATREIRKRREWKKLPIIMLTAKAMKEDQERCLEAGANDYMAKPLDVEKLLSLVRVWMPR